MFSDTSIVDAFKAVVAAQPEAVALRGAEVSFTYGQLGHLAVAAAHHLAADGVGQGDIVAVQTEDPLVMLATLFGAALIGATWTQGANAGLNDLKGRLKATYDSAETGRIPGARPIDQTWAAIPEGANPAALKGPADSDAIWFLNATSGTTGTAKCVPVTHKIALRRTKANASLFAQKPQGRLTGLFRLGAGALLGRYTSAILYGWEILDSFETDVWARYRPDIVFGSPAQFRKAMGDTTLADRLPLAHLSGATAPEKFVRFLLGSFETVANGYGSSEGYNAMAIRKTLGPDGEIREELRPRAGVSVEVVDEQDQKLPVGQEGIVRVRSPLAVEGYFNNPQASASSFREGCFYPGDLGRWEADGRFVVTGRINDQFNIGGVKLNAALLDYALQMVDGIEDAVSFLLPRSDGSEELRVMLRLEAGASVDRVLSDARVALLRVGGKEAVPDRFLFIDEVPRNPNGKVNRAACVGLVHKAREDKAGG